MNLQEKLEALAAESDADAAALRRTLRRLMETETTKAKQSLDGKFATAIKLRNGNGNGNGNGHATPQWERVRDFLADQPGHQARSKDIQSTLGFSSSSLGSVFRNHKDTFKRVDHGVWGLLDAKTEIVVPSKGRVWERMRDYLKEHKQARLFEIAKALGTSDSSVATGATTHKDVFVRLSPGVYALKDEKARPARAAKPSKRKRAPLSAAGRKSLSAAAKRRWKEAKKNGMTIMGTKLKKREPKREPKLPLLDGAGA